MAIRLVTANIKSVPLMRQSRVEHDIDAVKNLGDVILWQEIEPERYKNAVEALLPDSEWEHCNINLEVPISLRKSKFEVLDSNFKLTHTGRKRVTPNRYLSWVVAKRVGSEKTVVFLNTHFLSSAWSNKKPLTKAWRRVRWHHHFKIMDEMVTRFVDSGYTVIGGGDWNRGDTTPKFLSTQRWLNTGSIDRMFVIEAVDGVRVRLDDVYTKNGLFTDHKPRICRLTLHGAEEYVAPISKPSFKDLPVLRK